MVTCTTVTVSAPLSVTVVEYTFRCVAGCTPDEDICGNVAYEKVQSDNVNFRVRIRVGGGIINTTRVTVNYTKNGVAQPAVTVDATSLNIGDWDVYLDSGVKYQASATYTITSVTAIKI